ATSALATGLPSASSTLPVTVMVFLSPALSESFLGCSLRPGGGDVTPAVPPPAWRPTFEGLLKAPRPTAISPARSSPQAAKIFGLYPSRAWAVASARVATAAGTATADRVAWATRRAVEAKSAAGGRPAAAGSTTARVSPRLVRRARRH